MENQQQERSLFDITFNDHVKQQLKSVAVMGGVTAIVALASSLLGLVNYFVEKNKPRPYQYESMDSAAAYGGAGILGLFIGLVISIFLFYFLNKFSRSAREGIESNNQSLIGEGLGSLASYFKIIGVLVIIVLILVFLAIVASL